MSIAVLTQVYDEIRRLAIAGSVVAGGDFRLKKLIAPLEQAGAKAPVFAKAAQAVKSVVESTEKTSAQSLLELCTLVNAVLYTQGETGIAGELRPLETMDLGLQATQATSRTLKPLLEALTTPGSGRLEVIRDSFERGAFRDLRLVKPALQALDDAYSDISNYVAKNVLPLYGQAILPELRKSFDITRGKAGDVNRLKLMHRLDVAGTRETVKLALENGAKSVKIAAIECLGTEPEDLKFLLEQATSKAKDIRAAALVALAKLDDDEAISVLQNALAGPDISIATIPVRDSSNKKLLRFVIDQLQGELDNLLVTKDKKVMAKSADRIEALLDCLTDRTDKSTEAFLLQTFARRADLLALKAEGVGQTINNRVAGLMAKCSKATQELLLSAHATLDSESLATALTAACRSQKPAAVFDMFSPYLEASTGSKKKTKDPGVMKADAVEDVLNQITSHQQWKHRDPDDALMAIEWDPRWLDLAVKLQNFSLVDGFARVGHGGMNKFLSAVFAETFKKAKIFHDCFAPLNLMVRIQHPDATDSVISTLTKFASPKAGGAWGFYVVGQLIPNLPPSAVPKLEAILPTLHDKAVNELLESIAALKNKA